MSKQKEIHDYIWRLIEPRIPYSKVFEAEVIEIDENNRTCIVKPLDEHLPEIEGVRLTSIVDSQESYFVLIPKISSVVLICPVNHDPLDLYVLGISEVEKLLSTVQESLFRQNDKFTIKSKEESLLSILQDLITEIEKSTYANGAGTTGPPINVAAITEIKGRLPKLFEE